MTKERHDSTDSGSSKTPLVVMAVGTLLVAALVVWALTGLVEPVGETGGVTAAVETGATAPPTAAATNDTNATATAPPPPQVEGDTATVVRISAEDTREQMRAGNAVVVDVRDAASYERLHIAESIHVPFAGVEAAIDTLPKDKLIVTYCT
jgi:hypothetical protein